MGKKKKTDWKLLLSNAIKVSGEDKVCIAVSSEKKCGIFNNIAELQDRIRDGFTEQDRTVGNWLANSLKKLGKEHKSGKNSSYYKGPKQKPSEYEIE